MPFPTRTTLLKKIFLKWLVAVFHCDSLVDPAWPLGTATGWLFSKKINGKPNNTIFHLSKMSLTVSYRKGENIFVKCFSFFVKSFWQSSRVGYILYDMPCAANIYWMLEWVKTNISCTYNIVMWRALDRGNKNPPSVAYIKFPWSFTLILNPYPHIFVWTSWSQNCRKYMCS